MKGISGLSPLLTMSFNLERENLTKVKFVYRNNPGADSSDKRDRSELPLRCITKYSILNFDSL